VTHGVSLSRHDQGAVCVFFEGDPELGKSETPFIIRSSRSTARRMLRTDRLVSDSGAAAVAAACAAAAGADKAAISCSSSSLASDSPVSSAWTSLPIRSMDSFFLAFLLESVIPELPFLHVCCGK